MTVSWYGVRGARSDAQWKNGLITTLVMVWPSESILGGVPPDGGIVGFQVVGEQRLGEVEVAVERLAVRVEQQLARVAAVPRRRVPRAVHPEAVALARGDGGQVACQT